MERDDTIIDPVKKKIMDFTKLFEDTLTFISLSFPDPLRPVGKTIFERISQTTDDLTKADEVIELFGRWIRARRGAFYHMKSLMDTLDGTTGEGVDLTLKAKLIILPLVKGMLEALETDRDLVKDLENVLPIIEKSAEGSKVVLERTDAYLEFVGYDPKKQSSDFEKFFKALVGFQFSIADVFLENMGKKFEKMKHEFERGQAVKKRDE
ncbi:MAG: hypothetical protein ACFE7E_03970 [Candidatus Hodarchaeota archaeon]